MSHITEEVRDIAKVEINRQCELNADLMHDIAHEEVNRCINKRFTDRAVHIAVRNYMSRHLEKVVRHEVKKEEIRDIVKEALNSSYGCNTSSGSGLRHQQRYQPRNDNRSGTLWLTAEDKMLKDNFESFVTEASRQHGRSEQAIKCRINDKDLLER